jgi:DNA-directed RNA polymerase specialized sigma24 family protein
MSADEQRDGDAWGDPDRADWEVHRSSRGAAADAAFGRLFERTFLVVVGRLRHLNAPDAEDAAMAAFIREYERRGQRLQTRIHFRNYMTLGAGWEAARQRQGRSLEVPQFDGEGVAVGPGVASASVLSSVVSAAPAADSEWLALLGWQLPALVEDETVHVFLRLQRLSSTEIASFLGTTVDAERARWMRLKRKLADLYGIDFDDIF